MAIVRYTLFIGLQWPYHPYIVNGRSLLQLRRNIRPIFLGLGFSFVYVCTGFWVTRNFGNKEHFQAAT